MKIIVGGANGISRSIIGYLSHGNNDIAVVDKDDGALNDIAQEWDIMPIYGSVAHPDILKQAGADDADLLIAATDNDETNMVACQAGYTLFNIPRRVACIDSRIYFKAAWGGLFNEESLPIDLVVSPEYEIAKAVMDIIKIPGMSAVYPLAGQKLKLLSFRITKKCPLVQIPLRNLPENYPDLKIRIVSILRNGKVIVPDGDDMLHGGDEISLLVESDELDNMLHVFDLEHKPNEKILIVGGSQTALYLAERLEEDDGIISCKIIDDNFRDAERLAGRLNKTEVYNGSIMSEAILADIGIDEAEVSVAVDLEDKDNLVASMVAKKNGVESTIALVSERTANTQIINIGENILVDRASIIISSILKELRKANIVHAYSLGASLGEVWEVAIHGDSTLIGSNIEDVNIPDNSRIYALYRNGEVYFDLKGKQFAEDDHPILFCASSAIRKVEKVFA